MSPENHPNLRGRTTLLIESELLLGGYFRQCFISEDMEEVEVATQVPNNLLELMNNRGIESAIIHVANLDEEAPVMETHEAGKKIVVIKRYSPVTIVETRMYERFEEAGIPTVEKRSDCFGRALTCLSKLFEENTT